MTVLWRWMSRLLMIVLALVLILAAIWTYGRLTSPTPAQIAAVAVMQEREPLPPGENGFELLMAAPALPKGGVPSALQCGDSDPCIAQIEKAPEANAAAIDAIRPTLVAAERALRAPAFRDTREDVAFDSLLPPFQVVTALDSLRAFDFATGQTLAALDATCTDTLSAVRWARESDSLIHGMIGLALFRQNARLIAEMRQRAPTDALPASCVALALAPDPAVDGLMCNAMRGEWRFMNAALPSLMARGQKQDSALARLGSKITVDTEWQMAATAESFATACGDAAREAAREDRLLVLPPATTRWVDQVAYPASVVLLDIASPAYADYFDRQLDYVAQRRLLAALLQMDAMDVELDAAARFDALPTALRDGPRPLRFDAATSTLRVAQRGRYSTQIADGEMVLPLPSGETPIADANAEPDGAL